MSRFDGAAPPPQLESLFHHSRASSGSRVRLSVVTFWARIPFDGLVPCRDVPSFGSNCSYLSLHLRFQARRTCFARTSTLTQHPRRFVIISNDRIGKLQRKSAVRLHKILDREQHQQQQPREYVELSSGTELMENERALTQRGIPMIQMVDRKPLRSPNTVQPKLRRR